MSVAYSQELESVSVDVELFSEYEECLEAFKLFSALGDSQINETL